MPGFRGSWEALIPAPVLSALQVAIAPTNRTPSARTARWTARRPPSVDGEACAGVLNPDGGARGGGTAGGGGDAWSCAGPPPWAPAAPGEAAARAGPERPGAPGGSATAGWLSWRRGGSPRRAGDAG